MITQHRCQSLLCRTKSLNSYECAAKLGPSDSLITSLSWVCLCCLNCCRLGPNIPPVPLLPRQQKATRALRRLWNALSMSPHPLRPTKRAKPSRLAQPPSGPSTPPCSDPVNSTEEPLHPGRHLIPHFHPSEQAL